MSRIVDINNEAIISLTGTTVDASLVNYGQILQASNTITPWLDTKLFPIIQITASLAPDAKGYIHWGIGTDDNTPDGQVLATDTITPSHNMTTEWDSRTRWARIFLSGTNPGELSYVLKPTPTGIKIVDDSGSIVSVTSNAMQIVYRDVSGILGSTDSGGTAGNALYTSLTDADGRPLAKVVDTLATGLRDNSGENLSSTGSSGDHLLLGTYDRQSTDVVFFMDLSTITLEDSVALPGTYTILGTYASPTLTVTSVSLDGIESSISELKPGYLFQDNKWISSIDGPVITISGSDGAIFSPFEVSTETTISHLIHANVFPIVDHIEDTYGWGDVRVAFVSKDVSVDFMSSNTFKTRLDNSMSVMLHSTGTANNIHAQLNSFRNGGFDHQTKESRALVLAYNDIEDNVALNTSFSRISVAHVGNPSGIASLTTSNTGNGSAYIIPSDIDRSESVLNIVFGDLYHNNNALAIVPSDICGHAQASDIDDVPGGVALCYALADISGIQIGTTNPKTTSNNAVYVHFNDASGFSHTSSNPLHITIGGDHIDGLMMDTSVGDTMTRFVDINDSDISASSFNLNSLNLSNEAAVPVWFKIYDTHDGIITYAEQTNNYAAAQDVLKLNIAVPALTSRDIQFEKGVIFNHGLAARVSTKHHYDASTDGNLGTQAQTYLSINHSRVSLSSAKLATNVASRPEPIANNIRAFDINRNGVTLRGYMNTIENSNEVSKILFMPLEATGITGDHDDITLTLKNLSGDNITLTSLVSYETLYNSPRIAGDAKLLELETPAGLGTYTVIVGLNSEDNSFAHIAHLQDEDIDMSLVSITRYGTVGSFLILTDRATGDTTFLITNVNTLTQDTDICQTDLFMPGANGTLASFDGLTTDHNAYVISDITTLENLPFQSPNAWDLSAYLITYDTSVYIIDSNNTITQQYLYNTEVNDPSTNRWNYFGISAGHTDGSSWCFSTQKMVGYVHNDDDTIWRTSIARYNRDLNATQVDVSYYSGTTDMSAVTVSGVYTHSNGFKVSYYDSSAGNYDDIDRVVVWWGTDASYDFALSDLGGSHKFIQPTSILTTPPATGGAGNDAVDGGGGLNDGPINP